MPSTILDAFGKPATAIGSGGPLFARSADDDRLRPQAPNHFDDYISLLSSGRWRSLVSESRAIGSVGLVAAALSQKADYLSASEWRPYFTGKDSDYGELAETLLEETSALCCTRGPRYDWCTLWWLGVLAAGCDGGYFLLLTSNADGWPLVQPLEAHRIGQRGAGAQIIEPGHAFTTVRSASGDTTRIETPYAGLKIVNGIVYNQAGAEVAYRVLGSTSEQDQDISARDMIHIGAPRWFSEGRPAPQIARGLLDLMGVGVASSAQLDQQIAHAKQTFVETNDTGKRDPIKDLVNPSPTSPTAAGTITEVIERGNIRYVKKAGGDFRAFESKNPSDQWMNFDYRTASRAIAAAGWRIEMLDPKELSAGAANQAFQDQINTLIVSGFREYRHAADRVTKYRISKFTQIGQLPDHPEFLKWATTPPPEFVVNRNSAKIDIEMVRAGADSMPHVHRRAGMRSRHVLISQAKFIYDKKQIAKQFSKDGITIDPDELGTLSIPGDALAAAGATDPENSTAKKTE